MPLFRGPLHNRVVPPPYARRMKLAILLSILLSSPTVTMPDPAPTPLVIAHRGASGERPEHSRMAYERAIEQGADYIEPDLVMTLDGHLVVRHENEIGGTTDVAQHPQFAARHTTRQIDGSPVTGWFTEDFTLEELKTLRVRERLPLLRPTSAAFDGRDSILTLDEVIDIAEAASQRTGRTIRIAPELKHPSHFIARGLHIEEAMVEVLRRRGLTGANAPMLIQCFEVGTLQRLSQVIETPLLQLMQVHGGPQDHPGLTYADMATASGLKTIATYADFIGVETAMVLPRDAEGRSLSPTSLIPQAHDNGLKVVVWTLRAENQFLPLEYRSSKNPSDHGDLTGYLQRFYGLGADAVFSDFPGMAVKAR